MLSVTFVTTVYNKELYLERVVNALTKQIGDFKREFIFIDDGSTDKSLEILHTHKDKLPNCQIISKANEGPSKAVNLGISLAKNAFIKFVDGDDLLLPHATIALMDTQRSSGADVVFGKLATYDPFQKTNLTSYSTVYPPGKIIINPLESILKGGVSGISSIGMTRGLISLKLLQKVGGADEKVFIQDYSISLRLSAMSSFASVNSVIALQVNDVNANHVSFNTVQERYDTILSLYNFSLEYPEASTKYAYSINLRIKKIIAKMAKVHKLNFLTHYLAYLRAKFITQLSFKELVAEAKAALEWMDENFVNQIRKM